MRITSKGQVTIPLHIREAAGLLPNTEVEFDFDGENVKIFKIAPTKGTSRGDRLLSRMWGAAKPGGMTTDEIMALTRGED